MGATDASGRVLTALGGLLKSAALENPKFLGQVIELPRTATLAEVLRAIDENAGEAARGDQEIRYVEGVREVVSFKELSAAATPDKDGSIAPGVSLPWKDGGVYLISGAGSADGGAQICTVGCA